MKGCRELKIKVFIVSGKAQMEAIGKAENSGYLVRRTRKKLNKQEAEEETDAEGCGWVSVATGFETEGRVPAEVYLSH